MFSSSSSSSFPFTLQALLLLSAFCSSTAKGTPTSPPCGYLYDRSNPLFSEAILTDNGLFQVKRSPSLVLVVLCEADVTFGINLARTHNLTLSVLGGGHSGSGYSLAPCGLVISMLHYNNITRLNDDQLIVQAGARWQDVYEFLEEKLDGEYVAVGGGCPAVGVVGFLMGGGLSYLTRLYGLGSDNLVSASVHLYDGSFITVDQDHYVDLYWAIRGGGGGNFGIISTVTLTIHRAQDSAAAVVVWNGVPVAKQVLPKYSQWLETNAPPDVGAPSLLFRDNSSPDRSQWNVSFSVSLFTISCPAMSHLKDVVGALLSYVGVEADSVVYYDSFYDYINQQPPSTSLGGDWGMIQSGVYSDSTALTDEVVDGFVEGLLEAPGYRSIINFHDGGGFLKRGVPSSQTVQDRATMGPLLGGGAFPYRDFLLVYQVKAIWKPTQGTLQDNLSWTQKMRSIIYPTTNNKAYINYIDNLLEDWAVAYYGQNLKLLQSIQKKYDPEGLFTFEQSIFASL